MMNFILFGTCSGYCYYDQVQHGDGYSSHHHERVPSVTSESAKAAQFAAMNAVSQAKPPTNIPEVTTSIILDFLDSSLASAIEFGPFESVGLVDLIWAKSLRDAKSDLWTVARLLQCEPHYYQWEFSQALLQAVRREDRGVIEWLEAHFPGCPVTCAVVEEIASRGWLWLLQLLLPGRGRKGIRASSKALDNAASNGHWDVVHWLVENASDASTKSSSRLVAISVSTNNLKELVWLMGRGYESIPEFPECTEVEWPTRKEIFIHVLQQVEWMAASALSQAAQHDDIRFAKWVMAHYDTTTGNSALQYSAQTASKHGCVAILRWLLKRLRALGKCDDLSEIMFVAAENGKVEVVKRLCKKYAKKTSVHLFRMKTFQQPNGCAFAMDVAASQGHVQVLQILQNAKILSRDVRRLSSIREQRQQPQCTSWAMDSAAFAGHLDVVQWLHFNRSEGCTTAAMDKAAVNGHLEVVKWLSQNRSEGCSSWALDMVASKSAQGSNDMTEKDFYKKQLQIFQLMYQTSASCTFAAMDGAAANGNLEMLKWLHENTSAGFTSKAMDMAAENGHLDIIEWLHSLKYSTCTTAAMDNAASNGHLDVVKWLDLNRSEGCTHAAMDRAAANGHLNVLTWLHNNRSEGCTADALDNAADTGNFKMTKWLLSSWSKGVASTALVKAANNGHLRVVQCLAPRCTPQELVPGVREAVEHEHFEVALFLHSLCRHVNSIQPVLRRASLFFRGEIDLRRWMDENSQDGVHSRVRAFPP